VVVGTTFPSARRSRWRRPAGALLLLTAVLALHALLLGGWGTRPGAGSAPVLQVRPVWLATAQPRAQAEPEAAPAPAEHRAPATAATPGVPAAPRPAPAASAAPPTAPAQAAPAAGEAQARAPTPGDATATPPPVYATRWPAAATLRYETHRPQRSGNAELAWQPGPGGWRLALTGTGHANGMVSIGGFDEAGLAPLRHVEIRRGRETRAANFQRDSGRITFSGPGVEHPLLPGAQDRLSWLVQVAAVLNADATLAEPGTELRFAVAGVRGDAEVWVFTVQPRADLELPAGPVRAAVHLRREPRRAWDTEVQVWLDPAREHLPVQLWLRLRATGEGTEYRLSQIVAP
jgi:hypothetical protein